MFAIGLVLIVADATWSVATIGMSRPAGFEDAQNPIWLHVVDSAIAVLWMGVAALIVARRPRNAVGWILVVACIGFPLGDGAEAYARWSLAQVPPARLPATVLVAWTVNWTWALTSLSVPFLLLLFPDGRLPSRRWRPVLWIAAANAALAMAVSATWPELDAFPGIANPFGMAASERAATQLPMFDLVVHLIVSVAGFVSLLFRYRRGDEVERRQLLWFAYATVMLLLVVGVVSRALGPAASTLAEALAGLGVLAAIAVAILRYRLYEIARIISRTMMYGAVSAVLATIYASVTILPAAALGAPAGASDVLVAAATLATAAAFVPVRRRVRHVVDRRFNRARYDAQRVLDAFVARQRHDLHVAHLVADVRDVVTDTIQPSHVSLWLPSGRW